MISASLSLSDIGTKVAQGIGRKTLANIERINSNRYSFNLDCMILLGTLKLDSRFDANRFGRIIKNASKDQTEELRNAFMNEENSHSSYAYRSDDCGVHIHGSWY